MKKFIVLFDSFGKEMKPEEFVGEITSDVRKLWKQKGYIAFYSFDAASIKSISKHNKSPVTFFVGDVVELRDLSTLVSTDNFQRLQDYALKYDAYKTIVVNKLVFQVSNQAILLVGENLEYPEKLKEKVDGRGKRPRAKLDEEE